MEVICCAISYAWRDAVIYRVQRVSFNVRMKVSKEQETNLQSLGSALKFGAVVTLKYDHGNFRVLPKFLMRRMRE